MALTFHLQYPDYLWGAGLESAEGGGGGDGWRIDISERPEQLNNVYMPAASRGYTATTKKKSAALLK